MRKSRPARAATWLAYRGVSALIHQPRLLRLLAWASRRQPWFGRLQKLAASRADVVASFERPHSFSSTSHRPNLVAGDFIMGMESGPRHSAERQLLEAQFPPADTFGTCASDEVQRRIGALLAGTERRFDLIDDYMVPVAWQAIGGAFGNALPPMPAGDRMLKNLRYLGAQLIVGPVATEAVQQRARESAAEVNAWVRAHVASLEPVWTARCPGTRDEIARNVVGMLWVGHPATAQSGALILQEMFPRRGQPEVAAFIARVRQHAQPWHDPALRAQARTHVLEALRLRPPFPVLTRDVPRSTLYGVHGEGRVEGGDKLTLSAIGALSDPTATQAPRAYCPGRDFKDPRDAYLMFGWGARQCPGRDPVVEILASALLGLWKLPHLDWAGPWWRRLAFDGPIISSMPLKFRAPD